MVDDLTGLRGYSVSPSGPLAAWQNDDLGLTEHARQIVAQAFPRAFRVVDWPTLRDAFKCHDALANRAKLRINRHGVTGTWLSASGASLLGVGPLVGNGRSQSVLIVLGCSLVAIGALGGLWHLLGHSGRAAWMKERLWTERLRQFHFQYPINNLEAAIAGMVDSAELERYQAARDGALAAFASDIERNLRARGFAHAIRWLADDHDDARVWGQSTWQTNRVPPGIAMTAEHRELFECLAYSRIGIQEVYTQLNLKPRSNSQGEMARRVNRYGNIATFAFVLLLASAGLIILFSHGKESLTSAVLIAASSVTAAWGLYFRLLDQGFGYSADAERFLLYGEQVELVRQRFDAAGDDLHGKIVALRQLETFTYREMRQFLRAHLRTRFLG